MSDFIMKSLSTATSIEGSELASIRTGFNCVPKRAQHPYVTSQLQMCNLSVIGRPMHMKDYSTKPVVCNLWKGQVIKIKTKKLVD